MELKQGGCGTPIIGADGRISGWASLYRATAQAALYGVFTVMAVITGQFFLVQIHRELKKINSHLEKIEEFLYGDKRAELMAEQSFTRCAYENYPSIMAHEEQRIATISGLQQARKVAMKDVEFYMNDLDHTVSPTDTDGSPKKDVDINRDAAHTRQIQKCLDLSIQLYAMSWLMEAYFAQNYSSSYIKYIDDEMREYISKYDKRNLGALTVMHTRIVGVKDIGKVKNKAELEEEFHKKVESLNNVGISPIYKSMSAALHAATEKATYYVSSSGEVYAEKMPE